MTTITKERATGTIDVAHDRSLGFASFGPPNGKTIIWLHGTPGAATQIPENARARAEREGFRIIGIDRPGVGESTAHLYPNIVDFVDDLTIVLDTLNIDTCSVVGLSGGGPYTLAAAARLSERVDSVGVLGGVAPSVGLDAAPGGIVALARYAQPILRAGRIPVGNALAKFIFAATPIGDPAIRLYAHFSPEADKALLNEADFKAVFVGDLTARGHHQFSAALADAALFGRAWGFSLSEIAIPVYWWHGTEDNIVPFAHGEHVTSRLAHVDFRPIAGGGHLAGFGVADDVLDALVGL